jgi:hypothetical protein
VGNSGSLGLWMTIKGFNPSAPILAATAAELILGPPSEFSRAVLTGAGWVINLAVAEWAIRKRPAPPVHKSPR